MTIKFATKWNARRRSRAVRAARVHSNKTIGAIGALVEGHVLNVSAWQDKDKQGGVYKDYFPAATEYFRSNYPGWRGEQADDDLSIDLTSPLPPDLENSFDCVFNHTTLEHVFEVRAAFSTLARLSRDALLVVVPVVQPLHGPEDGDFWRFSPYCMRRMFAAEGIPLLLEHYGPRSGQVKYLTCFGARHSDPWAAKLEQAGIGSDPDLLERCRNLA